MYFYVCKLIEYSSTRFYIIIDRLWVGVAAALRAAAALGFSRRFTDLMLAHYLQGTSKLTHVKMTSFYLLSRSQ
jgi:hypothetical protein